MKGGWLLGMVIGWSPILARQHFHNYYYHWEGSTGAQEEGEEASGEGGGVIEENHLDFEINQNKFVNNEESIGYSDEFLESEQFIKVDGLKNKQEDPTIAADEVNNNHEKKTTEKVNDFIDHGETFPLLYDLTTEDFTSELEGSHSSTDKDINDLATKSNSEHKEEKSSATEMFDNILHPIDENTTKMEYDLIDEKLEVDERRNKPVDTIIVEDEVTKHRDKEITETVKENIYNSQVNSNFTLQDALHRL